MNVRSPARPLGRDAAAGLRAQLGRSFHVPNLDLGRLEASEQHTLAALAKKATGPTDGERPGFLDLGRLGRRARKKFESLIEVAGGLERGTFNREQEAREHQAKMDELALRARAKPKRPRLEEAGAIVLPRSLTVDALLSQHFDVACIGVLATLMAVFETGQGVGRMRFEGDDAIVIDSRYGFCAKVIDPDERIAPGEKLLLDHLADSGYLSIEKRGNLWTIRRGPELLDLDRRREKAA